MMNYSKFKFCFLWHVERARQEDLDPILTEERIFFARVELEDARASAIFVHSNLDELIMTHAF